MQSSGDASAAAPESCDARAESDNGASCDARAESDGGDARAEGDSGASCHARAESDNAGQHRTSMASHRDRVLGAVGRGRGRGRGSRVSVVSSAGQERERVHEPAAGPSISNPILSTEDLPEPARAARVSVHAAQFRQFSFDGHRRVRTLLPLTGFLQVATFVLFLVRVRHRIHVELGRVTKRFGLALCAFSVACTTVKIWLLIARGQDDADIATTLLFPLSCAAFVAHLSMTLPYLRTRAKVNFHICVLAISTAVTGLHRAVLGEWLGALYYGVGGPLLYACIARAVRTLRYALRKLSLGQRSRASSVGLMSLVRGLPPVLYLAANSGACLLFTDSPRDTCGTRLETNYAVSLVLIVAGFVPVLLTPEPVSLQQVVNLELPRSHLVAASFGACSFLCVAALAGTRERFEPVTTAVESIADASYVFALLGSLVLGAGVVKRAHTARDGDQQPTSRSEAGSHEPTVAPAPSRGVLARASVALDRFSENVKRTSEIHLFAWCALLHTFTLLYVVEKIFESVHPVFEKGLGVLSFSASTWHIFISAADNKLAWPVAQYGFHCFGTLLRAVADLREERYGEAVVSCLYVAIG